MSNKEFSDVNNLKISNGYLEWCALGFVEGVREAKTKNSTPPLNCDRGDGSLRGFITDNNRGIFSVRRVDTPS